LPIFRFSKALGLARGVKVFLNLESGVTRGAVPKNGGKGTDNKARRRASRQANELAKDREISRLENELRAAKERAYSEGVSSDVLSDVVRYEEKAENLRDARQHISRQKSKLKSKNWEIFQLKNELHAVKEQLESISDGSTSSGAKDELKTGTLPDFVIIGAQRCGTTTLYHLLTQHPHVERAATKELHFFDNHFDEGVEWYRGCFPPPEWKDGHRTITGEATPKYLFHPAVPERAAKVIPQAKLIALLRNPVDRAYSNYHHQVKNGHETRTFKEAIEAALRFEEVAEAEKILQPGEEDEASKREPRNGDERPNLRFLRRGVYVDQLRRWSEFFSDEQMLVLKSEDFFERTPENLKRILDFLNLPDWEPETLEVRNEGNYGRDMDPETRRRLEEYFEPHNQRLYEYLGVNFGW
jgi:Sulfotransferase domain